MEVCPCSFSLAGYNLTGEGGESSRMGRGIDAGIVATRGMRPLVAGDG